MSVLVYIESWEGTFKKSSFEAATYAAKLAGQLGAEAIALTIAASDDASVLGNYGITKVLSIANGSFNNQSYANAIVAAANQVGADTILISNTNNGKSIAPLVAAQKDAALITNVLDLPSSTNPFTVKRKAFSSKAFANYSTESANKVISLTPNSYGIEEQGGTAAVESFDFDINAEDLGLKSISIDKTTGKISLTEAELVVSAGRGLKGAENWGMIEELAEVLGAATACSKPVADIGWRPHSEHVGQTGIAINPELYIAIGISGAIQHLAGVNASKNIVVINTDPEAPFFKAADYGIVGDAFEVVPKLIEAVKAHKANN